MYSTYEESLVRCPYNPSHQVNRIRIQKHLIKCQSQHPNVKLVSCFYNYSHKLRPEELIEHYKICPNKTRLEGNRYLIPLDQFLCSYRKIDDEKAFSFDTIDSDSLSIGTTCHEMDVELKDIIEFEKLSSKIQKKLGSKKLKSKKRDPKDFELSTSSVSSGLSLYNEFQPLSLIENSQEPSYSMCLYDSLVKSDTKKGISRVKSMFTDNVSTKNSDIQSPGIQEENKDFYFCKDPKENAGLQIVDGYFRDISDFVNNASFIKDSTKSDISESISFLDEVMSIESDKIDENGFVIVSPVKNSKLRKICQPVSKKHKN